MSFFIFAGVSITTISKPSLRGPLWETLSSKPCELQCCYLHRQTHNWDFITISHLQKQIILRGVTWLSLSSLFVAVISMKTPSSLWENPLSSSYLSCTRCKYAVSRNHSSELAQTLCKSSSVLCSEGWVDMCNGLLNDVVLAYCCAVCWCGKRECVVRTCWMVWLMMSSETAKAACVDVGEKVWWMKWAVRQGLCTRASVCVCVCLWVKRKGEWEKQRQSSDTFFLLWL